MKLSRRSLLAGCAGTATAMLVPGNGWAAAVDNWAKPALWKMDAESLSVSRPVQNPAIGVAETAGSTILALPVAGRDTCNMALNPTGRLIWDSCDGKHTVPQIAGRVSRQFDIQVQQAYLDCMAFLFHLKLFTAILV